MSMKTRKIGSLSVSVVGLGCNNFGARLDAEHTAAVVDAALDAGINFFDTADIYGGTRSEEYLGRALRGRREQVVLATKFGMTLDEQRQGASPQYIKRAVEDSLRRLGTDRIDLYQLHRPDPKVDIADTLGALDELVRAGKVREIGSSNFNPEQIAQAEAVSKAAGRARFVSVQNEYSLLHRQPEAGVLDACAQRGIAFLPYFPLASGALTGKYRRGQPAPQGARLSVTDSPLATRFLSERSLAAVDALTDFATARGHSLLELAHSWLLAQKAVASVISGATSIEQVRANAAAASWELAAAELGEINRIAPA